MTTRPQTRIQAKNRHAILTAGLEAFSQYGFRGTTIDQIAEAAGLSKPNLLYYFPSKDAIYTALLERQLDTWLDPMRAINPDGDPVQELLSYARRKLEMSRDFPRESRLFANEIVQGAPHILDQIEGPLRRLVDDTAAIFQRWIERGQLADIDPKHLIFSIWATTQHYADFNVQVRGILCPEADEHLDDAADFLKIFYTRALQPSKG